MMLFVWRFLVLAPSLLHVICPSRQPILFAHANESGNSSPLSTPDSADFAGSSSEDVKSVLPEPKPTPFQLLPDSGDKEINVYDENYRSSHKLPRGGQKTENLNANRFRRNAKADPNQPLDLWDLREDFSNGYRYDDLIPPQNQLVNNIVRIINDKCGQNYWQAFYGRKRRFSELPWTDLSNCLNLAGQLDEGLFVEEPSYIVVRRETSSELGNDYDASGVEFIPPRGRKETEDLEDDSRLAFDDGNNSVEPRRRLSKRDSRQLENLLAFGKHQLPFVPNRGKKGNFDDILNSEDLFFPNRGKKGLHQIPFLLKRMSKLFQPLPDDLFYPNRGKKPSTGWTFVKEKRHKNVNGLVAELGLQDDYFMPNRGKKTNFLDGSSSNDDLADRLKALQHRDSNMKRQNREFLNNLSKHQNHDTFYTSRGRKRSSEADTAGYYDNVTDKIGLLNEARDQRSRTPEPSAPEVSSS